LVDADVSSVHVDKLSVTELSVDMVDMKDELESFDKEVDTIVTSVIFVKEQDVALVAKDAVLVTQFGELFSFESEIHLSISLLLNTDVIFGTTERI